MNQKKVLIGSCGGLTGIYLAKCFSRMGNYTIYGSDSAELSTGKHFADIFCRLPNADSPDFVDALVTLINNESIDYYLPTHSKEIRRIAKDENELRRKTHVKFLVSPIETFLALESKEQAYYSLSSAHIPTPKIVSDHPHAFPIIMKGNFGSGGSSVLRLENARVYQAYRDTSKDVSFFEYVKGQEYTVDCVFDPYGKLLAYNLRERIKMVGGAVVISQNSPDFDILPWIRKMENAWTFRGCVNFQFILQDNIPYFTDINLRYPSGGLPLTVESGINVPEMIIRLLDGEPIKWEDYSSDPKVRTMYRYFEEVFDYDSI